MTQPLICVIEDHPDSRVLITAVLTKAGTEVVTAGSGSELDLLLANGREPELVLIDLSLPGEDGTSILTRLREEVRYQETPMIALSTHAMAGDADRGRAAGFDEDITKPVDVATPPTVLSVFFDPPDRRRCGRSSGTPRQTIAKRNVDLTWFAPRCQKGAEA